jgi:hypothetical protein
MKVFGIVLATTTLTLSLAALFLEFRRASHMADEWYGEIWG